MPVATKKAPSKKAVNISKPAASPSAAKKPAPVVATGKAVLVKPGKAAKRVYSFGAGKGDGDGSMKPLLGGKGANLAEMSRIGLPVPPGFTITTEVCTYFYDNKRTYPPELDGQMHAGVAAMEKIMGTKFGDPVGMPMLVAVRSRRARLHAGHDGHDPEPGLERPVRAEPGQGDGQRAVRLRLLPPVHPDVRRRGHGRAEAARRGPRAVRDVVIDEAQARAASRQATSRTRS